jgi:two-component system, cell cycle sensor histidine kinase and response regulator CckA
METSMRILIVDDQPGLAETLALHLNILGHTAESLLRPSEALEVIHGYDVLVTDYNLPEMTGLELARRAYDQGWRGSLLLMSGHVSAIEEVLEHPLLRIILHKPFSTQTLVQALPPSE